MITTEMQNKYNEYLKEHIENVKKAYDWICINLPELIKPEFADILMENIYIHDRSKYGNEEYFPYAEYFYGTESEKVSTAFNYAWLHHIHENPHHWQHWILVHDDEPTEILDMPDEYIIEMICDWWSFSWKSGNLHEIFNWYKKHNKMQLSKNTRKKVDEILNKIKNKLEVNNG